MYVSCDDVISVSRHVNEIYPRNLGNLVRIESSGRKGMSRNKNVSTIAWLSGSLFRSWEDYALQSLVHDGGKCHGNVNCSIDFPACVNSSLIAAKTCLPKKSLKNALNVPSLSIQFLSFYLQFLLLAHQSSSFIFLHPSSFIFIL